MYGRGGASGEGGVEMELDVEEIEEEGSRPLCSNCAATMVLVREVFGVLYLESGAFFGDGVHCCDRYSGDWNDGGGGAE